MICALARKKIDASASSHSVPDNWQWHLMPCHHVVGRLAWHFDGVWTEPPGLGAILAVRAGGRQADPASPAAQFDLDIYAPGDGASRFTGLSRRSKPAVQARVLRLAPAQGLGLRKDRPYLWCPEFDWALDAVPC